MNLTQASWYSAVPWTMMAAVGCFAGTCSDFLIESGLSITVVRKIMQVRHAKSSHNLYRKKYQYIKIVEHKVGKQFV